MTKARIIVLVAFAAVTTCVYAARENTTLEGTLVSASCYLVDNSATGDDMGGFTGCGSGCLKQGKPAGLLTKNKRFYILDGPSSRFAPYVGREVRVTGIDHDCVFTVKKAEVRKKGKWEEIRTIFNLFHGS